VERERGRGGEKLQNKMPWERERKLQTLEHCFFPAANKKLV
jgi:hypothetical protein